MLSLIFQTALEVKVKVNELAETLDLKTLTSSSDVEINGVLLTDIVSDVVTHAQPGNLVVTAQIHSTFVSAAKLADACAIVFTLGREPTPDVLRLAEKAGISLFCSKMNSFELAGKLKTLGF